MKHIHLLLTFFFTAVLSACIGKSKQPAQQKDSVQTSNLFIGETEADIAAADTLLFKSLADAVKSLIPEEEVIGVWSHEVGGKAKIFHMIYRANGKNWLRPIYVEGEKFRLADEKQSVLLKRINAVEFSDMQNGGGYRLTDSTLVVYDAQNYAEELGRRVFDWNK